MAPAPSFHGHQWTYNPVRGSCLLLLLVMANLLLCQGNPCPSCGPDVFAISLRSLTDLFIDAVQLSHDFHNFSLVMINKFDEKYAQGKLYYINVTNTCHTNSFHFPEERDKVNQENNENITKWTLVLLYSWNNPLYHLVTELKSMKELLEDFLSTTMKIESMSEKLQALIESHFSKIVLPVLNMMHNASSTWSGLPSLTSSDEDRRHSELYNLFYCLHRDLHKVDMYIKFLGCRARKMC
ncbi:placental prolactin-related protein 1-like isoform X1 [Ovis canadensis]|uniref:placental prolactin-related protein 1-like isoform X1 n=1 Tax=Ovis canadensis TaxID=37174 RepID=UPI0038B62AFF